LLSYVVSFTSIVTFELAFAVNVPLEVPFCVTVNVALFTVGIVGVHVKSEYAPVVATVANDELSAFHAIVVSIAEILSYTAFLLGAVPVTPFHDEAYAVSET
jgi:hypothetical protein